MSTPKSASELRRAFTEFFSERGHIPVGAARLVPVDPTMLFTIAGMVQFKDFFTGKQVPPYKRATTVQPCVRTVDIDIIGTTTRHVTLFEMLGHFSFGDYFKKQAIPWAWEFYSGILGIPSDQLWITVHESDDEAEEIWRNDVGVPAEKIQRMGEDNFWKMGETGPCGPCSELYFDKGAQYGEGGGPAVGGAERYVEIGNLVFMQYERRTAGGELVALPAPSVDFGGGLERVLAILQGTDSVFRTDVLLPIVERAELISGVSMGGKFDPHLRVMADHARAIAFVVAEGVVPSNEGRGYVLRRLIRRVVLKATQLGVEDAVVAPLIASVVDTLGEAYPLLVKQQSQVTKVVTHEEESFRRTIKAGMAILDDYLADSTSGPHASGPHASGPYASGGPTVEGRPTIDGDIAFLLHDTHGFPIDLTREVAAERGMEVDMDGFESAMGKQRTRARSATKGARSAGEVQADSQVDLYKELINRSGTTEFVGYHALETESEIISVADCTSSLAATEVAKGRRVVEVFVRTTPFYAESGGQVGDTGMISTANGVAEIVDTTFAIPGLIRHIGIISAGDILPGDIARLEVDQIRRDALRRNHTGTHMLHWGLRQVLGDHVHQQGSLVAPDRLRFDFSHFAQVQQDELAEIEAMVNSNIVNDEPVHIFETSKEHAAELGAMAFFGDKYGDVVRVVEAGKSIELCGGVHVGALGMIGPVKVVSEGSVGSGIRRIEALTGTVAIVHMAEIEERLSRISRSLKVSPEEAPEALERTLARLKSLDEELKSLRARSRNDTARDLIARSDGGLVVDRLDGINPDELREIAALVRGGTDIEAVVLVGSPDSKRVAIVASVPKGSSVQASDLIAESAKAVGGGVGRGSDMAVAGGRDPSRIPEAIELARIRYGELIGHKG